MKKRLKNSADGPQYKHYQAIAAINAPNMETERGGWTQTERRTDRSGGHGSGTGRSTGHDVGTDNRREIETDENTSTRTEDGRPETTWGQKATGS